MTDLACWRHNVNQVVVRIRGSEYLMDGNEAFELATHIDNVILYRENESLGEEYKALRSRPKAKPTAGFIANLKASLGLNQGTFRR